MTFIIKHILIVKPLLNKLFTCNRMKVITTCVLSFLSFIYALADNGPVMGWSSWNTYRVNISDTLIMRQADALVRLGLDTLGYRYINIDDGFFGGRNPNTSSLTFHPKRFPNGLKPVVDHIHGLGLKAGIYSDAGANTCGNFWDADSIARGVGLYKNELRDCEDFFKNIGFDFIKVDFCGGDPRQNFDRLELVPEERYRTIHDAISATGRDDVRMNICRWNYPGTWASDIASSWRISQDITPHWESIKDIIGQNLYLSAYSSYGHYNDMDMLEIGKGLTETEERTHFGIWCMMSSPLLIGCDLTAIPESSLKILSNRKLIELNQAYPAQQGYVARHIGGCYVLVKDVGEVNGTSRAVAFYNPTDSAHSFSLSLEDIDLSSPATVENLWDGTCHTATEMMSEITVPAHGTDIYIIHGKERKMRRRYEAETAFLPDYQELVNPEAFNTAYYEPDSLCSGSMKVVNAGRSESNDIVFNNVYVNNAGNYKLLIRYRGIEDCDSWIYVNQQPVTGYHVRCSHNGFDEMTVNVHLEKGVNVIRFHNKESRLPEIDYIDVSK